MVVGLLVFIGFVIFGIMWLVALIRKSDNAKRNFIISLVCFILFIISVATDSTEPKNELANDKSSGEVEATTTEQEETDTEEQDEEAIKAEAEKEKKAAEEKKAKEKEEAKKAKEKEKKEEKERKAAEKEAKKEKVANQYKELVYLLSDKKVDLPSDSYELIMENGKLFPAENKENISKAKEKTTNEIGSKQLNKKVSPYFSEIVTIAGKIINIDETEYDEDTLTYIHMIDDDFNSFEIILLKKADNIFEDDRIRFWGIPVGENKFDNVSGGTTKTQMIVGAHVEKQ